jgi:hypothetical protein
VLANSREVHLGCFLQELYESPQRALSSEYAVSGEIRLGVAIGYFDSLGCFDVKAH